MYKISKFIVEKRYLFFVLFLGACIFSILAIPRVQINYDLTKYLPSDSQTKQALDVMENEFGLNGIASVVIADVTPDEAFTIKDEISQVRGVLQVNFENTDTYYKDGNALFKITLQEGDYSNLTKDAILHIKDLLKDYTVEMSGSSAHAVEQSQDVQKEMVVILAISIPIIILILFINANSYADILVFGIVVGAAVLINKGTNLFLGGISYITNSIAIVLQLALAMDYSIMLLHRFEEEKKTYEPKEAAIQALRKSMTAISASSLTTIFGLVAIMFMKFSIGFDIGMVLAKGIICSLLSVFLLMPGILLVFNKWMLKTKHREFIPDLPFIHKYAIKTRFFMPVIFLVIVGCAFVLQRNNTFEFSLDRKGNTALTDEFGKTNSLVIMVPKGDDEKEQEIVDLMHQNPNITEENSIVNLGIRKEMNADEFANKANLSLKEAYGVYGLIHEEDQQTTINNEELFKFIKNNNSILEFSTEQLASINQLLQILAIKDQSLTYAHFAGVLGFNPDTANLIYTYYETDINNKSYPLNDIIDFMNSNGDLLGLSTEQKAQMNPLSKIKELNGQSVDVNTFASVLDISTDDAQMIMAIYEMSQDKQVYPTQAILNYMNNNNQTLGLTSEQLLSITQLIGLIPYKDVPMTSAEFTSFLNLPIDTVTQLFTAYNGAYTSNLTEIPFGAMIQFMVAQKDALGLTDEIMNQIIPIYYTLNNIPLKTSEFAAVYDITPPQMAAIYAYYGLENNYQVSNESFNEVITFMTNNSTLLKLSTDQISQVEFILNILSDLNSELYANQLSTLLSLDQNKVIGIYAYYETTKHISTASVKFPTMITYIITNAGNLGLTSEQSTLMNQVGGIISMTNLTPKDGATLLNVPLTDAKLLFSIYDVKTNNISYSLVKSINYMNDYKDTLGLTAEQESMVTEVKNQMNDAINFYESDAYSRLIFNVNLKSTDQDSLKLVKQLRTDLKSYYNEYYVLGDSANILDIKDSFNSDVLIVSLISILSIFIVLFISFNSIIIPILLILVIQGSIWINLSFPSLTSTPIIFLGYIIVTAIQMGATIDYAILMTERYRGFRKEFMRFEAINKAIHASLPTIFTSGGILIVSGFSVGLLSSIPAISGLGTLIGRGALISVILVLFILPQLLILSDGLIMKRLLNRK